MSEPSTPETPRIFLSYSRNDRAAAIALKAELERRGLPVFRDEDDIRVGDGWMNRLQETLKTCSGFIVLVGRDGVRRWVGAEVEVALTRHFGPHDDSQRLPIFPILLEGAGPEALPPFLALFQSLPWSGSGTLPDGFVDTVRTRTPKSVPMPPFDGRPFLGLKAFQKDDARLFFGRRQETLEAISFLGDQQGGNPKSLEEGPRYVRWLQIEGNSGSGKSSLVNAGLLPMVERGALWARTGLDQWTVIGPMMPGADPVTKLADVLEAALVPEKANRQIEGRRDRLLKGDDLLALMLREQKEKDSGFLLVIDQFEELFTFAEEASRKQFDALIACALQDPECPLFVISTVRADFLDRFEHLPALQAIYNSRCKRYFLPTASEGSLKEIIEGPAKLAGLEVKEVTTAILEDARDEVGALPLVENALNRLWEKCEGNRLSGDYYQAQGGLAGMLSVGADSLLNFIESKVSGGRYGALELLLRLTRIDDDGRHSRERIPRDEAVEVAGGGDADRGEQILRLLSGEGRLNASGGTADGALRLLTVTTEPDGRQFVDLIHETLVRPRGQNGTSGKRVGYWPTLYDYIEKNRDRPVLTQQLKKDAAIWKDSRWIGRWRYRASLTSLLRYRSLRPDPNSDGGRFLLWSRRVAIIQGVVSLAVVCVLGESAWWAKQNNFPLEYVFLKPMWWMGYVPEPDMVRIPDTGSPGTFVMGCKTGRDDVDGANCSDSEAKTETIAAPFYMGRYEVTFEQYDAFVWNQKRNGIMKPDGSAFEYPRDGGRDRFHRPVVNVNWNDVQEYIKWLNENAPGKSYRLPKEIEWEYAARADSTHVYPWGNVFRFDLANCNPKNVEGSKKVGEYAPNRWQLHDMIGNVWEWTADTYSETTQQGSVDDDKVAIRGGSWDYPEKYCRLSSRWSAERRPLYNNIGFRLVHSANAE